MDNIRQSRAEETIEDLQLGGLRLIQKKKAFRFGMDAVLLADFADIHPKDITADLGTGNGVLPLLLIGRGKGSFFHAFEILPEEAELAERNAELNSLQDRIHVVCGDVYHASAFIGKNVVDSAVCNPPYWLPDASMISENVQIATARNQAKDTLHRFFIGAYEILKGKGKLFLIYPAQQMLHVMKELQACHLEPKRFRLVYPKLSKPANLVLIEAVKDAKPTMHPMTPLVVYEENGQLTNELKSVYHVEDQTGVCFGE